MLLCESPVSSLHSRISGFQNSSGFRSKNGVEFFPYMSVTKALIEMMEEMPFEDIKVKELCDRAMIRKSTFYKHFADKFELLAFIVKETINDFNERIRQDSPTDDPVAFYNKMLDYVFEFAKVNQKLIRSAIRSDSLVLLLNIMSQQVMPDICQKLKQVQARGHRMPASPEVMATFFAGGISESLRSWFTSGKKCSEEDIKKQLSDIMRAVYQVENIREQKNDTEPIRADTKSEQHTVWALLPQLRCGGFISSPKAHLPKKSARILSIFVDKPVALYYNGQA